ncbi:putative dehydrogenase [Desulfocurvibacter africanus PCS]|uniref:Putative dehydrogenase n=1 Tax=Desulfocurvibacter africanus PCS TaxID=1262666 RepID=M5PVP2_DESAF|nr:Gfo/Idh/MocA family oxidoreductase [Desulfocurvibacter africanus]EMG38407.1 putative dehydrogenase [Desulfocurvibacter africanus PCS]
MAIRSALIGLGGIAWKYDAAKDLPYPLTQAGALLAQEGVDLLAGCSPEAADRDGFQRWCGLSVFDSHAKLLRACSPQLVGICSPTEFHYEHFRACIEAGVAMFWLEKPPAASIADTMEMAELARHHGVTVCVNYFRRFLPVYRRLKETIAGGLGKCHTISVMYSPGLLRNGCHLVDLLFYLTDAPDYELLWVDGADPKSPSFGIRLAGGPTAHVCGASLPYHSNTISAVCDEGIISVLYGGRATRFEKRIPNPDFPGFFTLEDHGGNPLGKAGIDDYMSHSLADLLFAHQQGRQPLSNLETALVSQRLMDQVLQAVTPCA